MPFSTLDVTPGEMVALCDYANDVDCRCTVDFIKGSQCMLCGLVDSSSPDGILHHTTSKQHQQGIQQYSVCARALLVHERTLLDESAATTSRRETVIAYLGDRIAHSDIVRGVGSFNTVAVNYLLRRCRTTELITAFKEIAGTPRSHTRGLCSVCMEHPSSIMFEKCKHVCICAACSRRLTTDDPEAGVRCPICRVQGKMLSVFIT